MMMAIYNKYIDEWFDLVESNKIKTCEEQKLLVKYVKNKLDTEEIIIDDAEIEKAINIPEKYFPYKFFPWQKFIKACMYGLYYKDGSLVFNEFFIMVGRGAGKNGEISTDAFYMASKAHGVMNYNIDFVATSEEQAKTSFMDIYELRENDKKIQKAFYATLEKMVNRTTKSTIQYNTSNAKTKDGKRTGCAIFDEIHAYENYDNIKVFTSGLGKRPKARIIYITTDGYVRGGVLDDFKKLSRDVLEGKIDNSRFFPFICKLDDEDEVENPENWEKANPSLRYFPDLKSTMIGEYEVAKRIPAKMQEFMTKRMNIPKQNEAVAVTSWENIEATNQEIPDLMGEMCVGGLDYASTRDFVGCGLLFKKDGKRIWKHHSFVCKNSPTLSLVQYDLKVAEEQGLCTIVDEPTIPPEMVVEWFFNMSAKYNILALALDKFRFGLLKEPFEAIGWYKRDTEHKDGKIIIVRSGEWTDSMVYPILEAGFDNHEIVYGDDSMMRWYTNNTYVETTGKGNKTFKKIEWQSRKTDGFFALIHAVSIEENIPIYQEAQIFDAIDF